MRRFLSALSVVGPLFAAGTVGTPVATPPSIPVDVATPVTVTSSIANPSPLAGDVNLLQFNSTGGNAVVLGVMQTTGNGTYTLQVTLNPATAGFIYLQVSAAFQGQIQRVLSGIISVAVTGPPVITSFSPQSAAGGAVVTVIGSNFVPAPGVQPTVTLAQQRGGTVTAPLLSANGGNLAFVVPTNAVTGPVVVSVGGQSASTMTPLTITGSSIFTLTASPANPNLIQGQSVALALQVNSSTGFDGLAQLSLLGVPSGVTMVFKPPSITAGQISVLTLSAPPNQPLGSSMLTVTASATVDGLALSQSANAQVTIQAPTTSLVGRTVVSDALETPLAGVTVTMLGKDGNGNITGCSGQTTSDAAGNFALLNLAANCVGPQLVGYNGTTATSPPGKYAGVNLAYTLVSGQATAPQVLIHLPRIDNAETFLVQQNASVDQSYSYATIPDLSVTVYAGTTFTMPDGTQPNPFPLAALNVPVDRLPDIKPPVPTMITAFIVAFQPANATTNQPVAVYYPNPLYTPSGVDMALLTLDPTHGAMVPYGTGAVSADGTQVVPDLDPNYPGHRYGLVHFDWHMPGYPPASQNNPSEICPAPCSPYPVDYSSGLEVIRETDISFGGARGTVSLVRTYRNGMQTAGTSFGPFGYGTNHNYGYELAVVTPSANSVIPLIMPDGNQFPFSEQGDGTYISSAAIPALAGAVMTIEPGNRKVVFPLPVLPEMRIFSRRSTACWSRPRTSGGSVPRRTSSSAV
jgi:hypothetical protein